MSYEEADVILEHGATDESLMETLQCLQEVSEKLETKYKPSKLYVQMEKMAKESSEIQVGETLSQKMNYYAMVLTGNKVADYFANSKEGYPCLYRVHEMDQTTNQKLEEMVEGLTTTFGGRKFEQLYHILEGMYPKGQYATTGSHYGLNLEHYCHCTSELRRGPDLIIEHALDVCYDKNPTDKEIEALETEMKTRAVELNQKVNPIGWFVEDYARCFKKTRR